MGQYSTTRILTTLKSYGSLFHKMLGTQQFRAGWIPYVVQLGIRQWPGGFGYGIKHLELFKKYIYFILVTVQSKSFTRRNNGLGIQLRKIQFVVEQ